MKKEKAKKQVKKDPVADVLKILESVSSENQPRIKFHLEQIKLHTGEITVEDVQYCLNIDKRMKEYAIKGL